MMLRFFVEASVTLNVVIVPSEVLPAFQKSLLPGTPPLKVFPRSDGFIASLLLFKGESLQCFRFTITWTLRFFFAP